MKVINISSDGVTMTIELWSFWAWVRGTQHPQRKYRFWGHEWYDDASGVPVDIQMQCELDNKLNIYKFQKEFNKNANNSD